MPAIGFTPDRLVLLIDDEVVLARALARTLKQRGFESAIADSGPSGLRLLQEGLTAEVAIIDLHMPEMSGAQLLDELRRRHPSLPVIVHSAAMNERIAEHLLSRGAAACLVKGDPEALLVELNKASKSSADTHSEALGGRSA